MLISPDLPRIGSRCDFTFETRMVVELVRLFSQRAADRRCFRVTRATRQSVECVGVGKIRAKSGVAPAQTRTGFDPETSSAQVRTTSDCPHRFAHNFFPVLACKCPIYVVSTGLIAYW